MGLIRLGAVNIRYATIKFDLVDACRLALVALIRSIFNFFGSRTVERQYSKKPARQRLAWASAPESSRYRSERPRDFPACRLLYGFNLIPE
jgi:hypothetical protein